MFHNVSHSNNSKYYTILLDLHLFSQKLLNSILPERKQRLPPTNFSFTYTSKITKVFFFLSHRHFDKKHLFGKNLEKLRQLKVMLF